MIAGGGPARLLRVYGLWVLLVTAVVVAAAYAVGRAAPREYQSAAIVVVESRVRQNTTPVPPDMGTEKELAQSGLVVEPAARKLGIGIGDMVDGLVVSVAADANVLTFAYTHADPRTAQTRADALSRAYVTYRNAGENDKVTSAATSTQHATLVTPAPLPGAPVDRPIYIDLGLGLAIGLLLGIGTALIRDRLSDRVRGRDDFARVLGGAVLATVPRERRWRGREDQRPVLLRSPRSPVAESFRYLRSRLQPVLPGGGTTVLVTSAAEREGRTTTAANLATALAFAGRTVILLDADLRGPRVHAVFGLADGPGLADVLADRAAVADVLRDTPVPGLRLLTAGRAAADAGDLLDSAGLRRIVRTLRSRCDVVVIDSAPVLSVADPLPLAAVSDHLLLVGDQRRSTRAAIRRALAELGETVEGTVSGVLLNVPRSAGGLSPRGRLAAPEAEPARPEPVRPSSTLYGSPVVPGPSGPEHGDVERTRDISELTRDGKVPAQRGEPG